MNDYSNLRYGISDENREILDEKLGIYADVRASQLKSNTKVPKRKSKAIKKAALIGSIAFLITVIGANISALNKGKGRITKAINETTNVLEYTGEYSVLDHSDGFVVQNMKTGKTYPVEAFCDDVIKIIEEDGYTEKEAKLYIEETYGIDTGLTSLEAINLGIEHMHEEDDVKKGVSK